MSRNQHVKVSVYFVLPLIRKLILAVKPSIGIPFLKEMKTFPIKTKHFWKLQENKGDTCISTVHVYMTLIYACHCSIEGAVMWCKVSLVLCTITCFVVNVKFTMFSLTKSTQWLYSMRGDTPRYQWWSRILDIYLLCTSWIYSSLVINVTPDQRTITFSWGWSELTDRNVELYPQFFLELITTQLRFYMVSPQLSLLIILTMQSYKFYLYHYFNKTYSNERLVLVIDDGTRAQFHRAA